jgi:hypothetical protein
MENGTILYRFYYLHRQGTKLVKGIEGQCRSRPGERDVMEEKTATRKRSAVGGLAPIRPAASCRIGSLSRRSVRLALQKQLGRKRRGLGEVQARPPMTLGAAARVRLIIWCRACQHQVEPEPAEMAARHGADTTVLEWRERLLCSRCRSRKIDMVLIGATLRSDP